MHGVLHTITHAEWAAVQRSEGVGSSQHGYQVVRVRCSCYSGATVEAETLRAAPSALHLGRRALPSARYLGLLLEGALAMWGLQQHGPSLVTRRCSWHLCQCPTPCTQLLAGRACCYMVAISTRLRAHN